MTFAFVSPVSMIAWMQDFSQALGQVWRPENLRQEQNRPARVFVLRDSQECALKHWVGRELFCACKKPRIDLCVYGAQLRLQARRVAFRVVHQKAWIDAEESRKQLAGCVRQMGPGATLDLREIRLAQSAPDLMLHCGGQFLLRHRTTQAAQRTFYSAEGAEFVAKFHGNRLLQSANMILRIAILSSEIGFPSRFLYLAENKCFKELLKAGCLEFQTRNLVCAANQIYSGFLSDCRSIPSCWHFL